MKTTRLAGRWALVACGLLLSLPLITDAATVSWTNIAGGNWSVPANWSGGVLPAAADDVWITASGIYVVTQDVHVVVNSLTVGGNGGTQTVANAGFLLTLDGASAVNSRGVLTSAGTVNGSGQLNVGGRFNWAGGNVRVPITVTPAGILELAGAADKGLTGVLTNFGTVTWTGTGNLSFDPTLFDNRPGALLDFRSDASLLFYSGAPYVANAGTIRKSAGLGTNVFNNVPLLNTGVVEAQTGSILFSASGCRFEHGTRFLGSGTSVLGGGIVTLDGLIVSENLVLGGAGVIGTNTLSGVVQWAAGNIGPQGVVTVGTGDVLQLTGPAVKGLVGTLNNDGLVTWSGGGDFHLGSSTFNNRAGGVFDAMKDGLIHWPVGAPPVFINAGTFRKSVGTGTTALSGVIFRNSGIVDVQTGVVNFNVSGTTFDEGTQCIGAGTTLLSGGYMTLNGTIHSENLEIGGAAILGTNILKGTVRWTAGIIGNAAEVTVPSGGTFRLTGSPVKGINGGTLINEGLVSWSGEGDFHLGSATVNNRAGGVFDAIKDGLIHWPVGVQPFFINAGLFRKSGGTGTTAFSGVVFRNSGVVEAQIGTVVCNVTGSAFEDGTHFLGAGTNLLSGGSILLAGSIYSDNLELGGAAISGTNTLFGMIHWTAGYIDGPGQVTLATNGDLVLCGVNEKGVIGVLKNQGRIVLTDTGRLVMGSLTPVLATIHNEAGGRFEVASDAPLAWTAGSQPLVINDGLFRKSAGLATIFSGVPFVNTGTVDAQTGAIVFNATGTHFDSGSQLLGAGTNLLNGGLVTLSGSIHSENLEIAGAGILGTNTLTGTTRWTSGYIAPEGVVTIATNSVLDLAGPNAKGIIGVLNNLGTVRLSGSGTLAMGSQTVLALIHNHPGGIVEALSDAPLSWTAYAPPAFTNAGIFRKIGGTNFTDLNGVLFHNAGTVDAQTGVIRFLAAYTQSGGRLQFGLTSPSVFGQIQFAQTAPLTGTLAANLLGGFRPKAGETFSVISYFPSYTGGFDAFDLPNEAAWQTNTSIYSANGVTLTVLNARPGMDPIADKSIGEQFPLQFSIYGTDPDAGQVLTYALIDPPQGAGINASSGLFLWSPGEEQGPSTNFIRVLVTDSGTPPLSATNTFQVVVHEVNRLPRLEVPSVQPFDELNTLTVTNSATDPDIPANTLRFVLVSGPAGAELDSNTGVLTWTPTEAQGPGTNVIILAVIDNGVPSLGFTNRLTVIVREVNVAPGFADPGDQFVVPGDTLVLTNRASDTDLPANLLSFSLLEQPPQASIEPGTGRLTWKTGSSDAGATNRFTVVVRDNGVPILSATQSFRAIVLPLPRLSITEMDGALQVSWPALYAGYAPQATTNLNFQAGWSGLTNEVSMAGTNRFITDSVKAPQRFYRLSQP